MARIYQSYIDESSERYELSKEDILKGFRKECKLIVIINLITQYIAYLPKRLIICPDNKLTIACFLSETGRGDSLYFDEATEKILKSENEQMPHQTSHLEMIRLEEKDIDKIVENLELNINENLDDWSVDVPDGYFLFRFKASLIAGKKENRRVFRKTYICQAKVFEEAINKLKHSLEQIETSEADSFYDFYYYNGQDWTKIKIQPEPINRLHRDSIKKAIFILP